MQGRPKTKDGPHKVVFYWYQCPHEQCGYPSRSEIMVDVHERARHLVVQMKDHVDQVKDQLDPVDQMRDHADQVDPVDQGDPVDPDHPLMKDQMKDHATR